MLGAFMLSVLAAAVVQPATLTVSVGVERIGLSDPFGRGGVTSFSPLAPGIRTTFTRGAWYADAAGNLLDHSVRQRRIATTFGRTFASAGRFTFALEADYWELGFRRRAFRDGELSLDTVRTARTLIGSVLARAALPRSMTASCSLGLGWYRNRYDSALTVSDLSVSEVLGSDNAPIMKVQCGFQTGLMFRRLAFRASVRHFRLGSPHSSWTPGTEWSGDSAVDVRLFSRRSKTVFAGAYARFGPRGPSLVTDKTFGLRGTLKLR